MPTYEVLNARVKQKIATEADWISQEDAFGVIFEGEAAYVLAPDGSTPINFKIGDGTKKFSELPYFIAYYTNVTAQKVLSWINTTVNVSATSVFRANSLLTDIIIYNNSGSVIPLKIGTTDGGSEICSINIPNGANSIGRHYAFTDVETVYLTGITGLECSIFLLYIQMDESPAIPPSSAVSTKFPAGFVGIFEEITGLGLTYAAVWDFTTGLARLGFGYDNCVICGTNGTNVRGGAVSLPYKTGQTFGAKLGSALNQALLTVDNIAPFTVKTPIPAERYHTQSGGSDNPYGAAGPPVRTDLLESQSLGLGSPVSIQNYGIIDLWFKAIS
ncbi:hypothetical protein [Mucilaginibacter xinganensis]|uniref:Uncharacterized protein n=1 Tax=Mucilaginibacter xinganensis TaxID=1234841 RepID=A0A223NX19_9SPHI|nr:hypothetical protein [Mucilaginibacter xinganensis]ASU34423.1 hypothetical protein MuYL_2536 [Mucilaginibacter xinganensis]